MELGRVYKTGRFGRDFPILPELFAAVFSWYFCLQTQSITAMEGEQFARLFCTIRICVSSSHCLFCIVKLLQTIRTPEDLN
jgi:hypothetical protein